MTQTIVIANQKGGVGKSTLACLLSWWLAEHGYARVLLIDLDSQANSSRTMAQYKASVGSLALFSDPAVVLSAPAAGVTLLAAEPRLAEVEGLPTAPAVFSRQFSVVKTGFDAVVIDTPPALGRRMIAALVVADGVLCPIELEDYSIDGVANMLRTVFGVRQRWNPTLRFLGMLANRFNHHSAAQKRALQDLLAHYNEYVLPGKVSTRSAIPEAFSQGIPVWKLAKSSARDASVEVDQVFRLVRQRLEAVAEPARA